LLRRVITSLVAQHIKMRSSYAFIAKDTQRRQRFTPTTSTSPSFLMVRAFGSRCDLLLLIISTPKPQEQCSAWMLEHKRAIIRTHLSWYPCSLVSTTLGPTPTRCVCASYPEKQILVEPSSSVRQASSGKLLYGNGCLPVEWRQHCLTAGLTTALSLALLDESVSNSGTTMCSCRSALVTSFVLTTPSP